MLSLSGIDQKRLARRNAALTGDLVMIKRLLLLPLAAFVMAAQSAAPLRPEVPVMVGGDSEQDACGGTYRVRGLNPRGDNFLSVRSRPAAAGRELVRLRGGQMGYLCDASADGQWQGVVYGRIDCGVGTPIARSRPYRGPCASGWVSSRFVELVAG